MYIQMHMDTDAHDMDTTRIPLVVEDIIYPFFSRCFFVYFIPIRDFKSFL